MKKTLFSLLLCTLSLACLIFAACDSLGGGGGGEKDPPEHLKHDYAVKEVVSPTCTEGGYTVYFCECGDSYEADFTDPAHDWEETFTVDKAANCAQEGEKSRHCKRCDEVCDVQPVPVDPETHVFSLEYTVDVNPDCTHEGSESRHCVFCDVTADARPVPADPERHVWETEKKVDIRPTCSAEGKASRHCEYCQATCDEEVLSPDPNAEDAHNFGDWQYYTDNTHYKECADCHSNREENHVYENGFCVDCGFEENAEELYYIPIYDGEEIIAYEVQLKYCTQESVEIPATRGGLPVTTVSGTNGYNENVKSVTLPQSIEIIGNNAFKGFIALDSVNLPERVSAIGEYAFQGCTALGEINLHDGILTIGVGAFGESGLRTVTLPKYLETVENYAFSNCASLTEVNFNDNLKQIKDAAFLSTGLKSVTLPESIKVIEGGAFGYCEITDVVIPDGVQEVDDMAFYGSTGDGRKTVRATVPAQAVHAITSKYLTTVTVTSGDIPVGAFSACDNLVTADLRGTVSIGESAFDRLEKLERVNLPHSLKYIGASAFNLCKALDKVVLPENLLNVGDYAYSHCSSLSEIVIPESVTVINDGAFYDCASLSKISLHNKLTKIGSSAFDLCPAVKELVIPDSLKEIGKFALGMNSLEKLTAPSIVFEDYLNNVVSASRQSLKSVRITSGEFIDEQILYDAVLLESVYLCDGFKSIGDYAFRNCPTLSEIRIPESLQSIGTGAFYDCASLASIYLPESLTQLGNSAFNRCTLLNNVTLPRNITELNVGVFSGCVSLEKIVIPEGVNLIGEGAFEGCTSLKEIKITSAAETIGRSAFGDCNIETADIPVAQISNSDGFNYFGAIVNVKNLILRGDENCKVIEDGNSWRFESLINVSLIGIEIIEDEAFRTAPLLEKLVIDGSLVQICGNPFQNCRALEGVYISDLKAWCNIKFATPSQEEKRDSVYSNPLTRGVGHNLYLNGELVTDLVITDDIESISYGAFAGCNFNSITLPFIGASATETQNSDLFYIFGECQYSGDGLKVILKEGITRIGDGAFCPNRVNGNYITEVVLPQSLKTIGKDAFSRCNRLKNITLPKGLTSLGESAFSSCGLESITVPEGITEIPAGLFSGCYSLSTVNLPSSITSIGEFAFSSCNFKEFTVSDSVTSIGRYAFHHCYSLETLSLPFVGASIDAEGDNARFDYIFVYDAESEYDYIPKSLKTVVIRGGERIAKNAFDGAVNIQNLTLPFIGESKNATQNNHFGYIFGADNAEGNATAVPAALKTVVITDVNYVEERAFYGCENLQSVTVPETVTRIADYAFYNCKSLTSFNIPQSLTILSGYVFAESGLVSIEIPEQIMIINDGVFKNCKQLASVTLSGKLESVCKEVFDGCENLQMQEYENGLYLGNAENKYLLFVNIIDKEVTNFRIHDSAKIVAERAIYQCEKLVTVTIGNGLVNMRSSMISYCSALEKVVIGSGVKKISSNVFDWCSSLKEIYYYGNEQQWSEIEINAILNEKTVYYYREERPFPSGNYWHYGEDGVTVEKW